MYSLHVCTKVTNHRIRRRLVLYALILFVSRCSRASCCSGCAPVKVRFLCMRTTAGRGRWEEARECEPVTEVVELHSDNSCANLGCKESQLHQWRLVRVKAKSLAEMSRLRALASSA